MKKILFSLLMLCCMTAAWAEGTDDFVEVASASQMYNVLSGNARAKVRLTADIYLSDLGANFGDTFCSTFYGILDGDGHAIKGDHYADGTTERRNRTYLFTYSDGATFKNLTFKHIRKNSEDHSNQAIITSQAKNGCVFENITFENCGTWTNYDNAGSAAGWAENCTFTNITVKNSDFTADKNQSGCVVGHAIGCTFTKIKVENCESTSAADKGGGDPGNKAGGVVGRSDKCTFDEVEVLGSYIKTYCEYAGGVAGYSTQSKYSNCTIDDQSCVYAHGSQKVNADRISYRGGIVGYAVNGDIIQGCINSALIAGFNRGGGIVGESSNGGVIEGCLNTGMVIAITMEELNDFYNKYKNKTGMTCVTKTYQGKEYVIRIYNGNCTDMFNLGGIAGRISNSSVSKCANFGSVLFKKTNFANGGIVGTLVNGTISDCLSDFSGSSGVHGICGRTGGNSRIDNCLNMTTYKDFAAIDDDWTGFKSNDKNYSLTTAEDAHHIKKTTAADLESGKVCHLLGENWEQNLGTDAYPTPTGSKGVHHSRTVSNHYGTVCLPFAMQSNDKVKLYSMNEVNNGEDDVTIRFSYVDRVEAGHPALFCVEELGDITFESIDDEIIYNPPFPPMLGDWAFVGVFDTRVFSGDLTKTTYYISGDKIRNASVAVHIAPYRAYIFGPSIDKLTSNSTNRAKAIQFTLDDEDGETTALEMVGEDLVPVQKDGKSYSIMGTEVSEGYRGIVIKNGKKVIK
ncbi:MAG: hypothetical protein MJZ35_03805 [Bacteroidaceae bacterium]|nr:hypothetical protein [Bacteroidaceae bacterium]